MEFTKQKYRKHCIIFSFRNLLHSFFRQFTYPPCHLNYSNFVVNLIGKFSMHCGSLQQIVFSCLLLRRNSALPFHYASLENLISPQKPSLSMVDAAWVWVAVEKPFSEEVTSLSEVIGPAINKMQGISTKIQ